MYELLFAVAPQAAPTAVPDTQWEVSAEFHRLNVLLMRVEENELRQPVAKKVATATMSDAKIDGRYGTSQCTLLKLKLLMLHNLRLWFHVLACHVLVHFTCHVTDCWCNVREHFCMNNVKCCM